MMHAIAYDYNYLAHIITGVYMNILYSCIWLQIHKVYNEINIEQLNKNMQLAADYE